MNRNKLAASLLLILCGGLYALAGDMDVDNLTVEQDAIVHGKLIVTQRVTTSAYPTNGMVLYYSFNTNTTSVPDESGNGNTGIINGATWTSDGKINGAYIFDGTNDYIATTTNIAFPDSKYTLNVWIKKPTAPEAAKWRVIIGKFSGETSPFELCYGDGRTDAGSNSVTFLCWSGGSGIATINNESYNLQDGNWHMVSATYETGSQKLYFDGQLVGTNDYAGVLPTTTAVVSIGKGGWSPYHPYANGTIDEVLIYNRALSSNEVYNLYLYDVSPPTPALKVAADAEFDQGVKYIAPLGDLSMGSFTNQ